MAETKKTPSTAKETSSPKTITNSKSFSFDVKSVKNNVKKTFNSRPAFYTFLSILAVLVAIIAGFFFYNKGIFVAGTVNGEIITSPAFYSKLIKASGTDVFDSLVQQILIRAEARKKNITIKTDEVDKRIQEIQTSLGSKSAFESALKQNNLSINDLKEQLTVQLLVEKLLADKIKVTDEEIDKYIAENKDTTTNMSRTQVSNTIKSSKVNSEFDKWYQEIKKKAKISKFF